MPKNSTPKAATKSQATNTQPASKTKAKLAGKTTQNKKLAPAESKTASKTVTKKPVTTAQPKPVTKNNTVNNNTPKKQRSVVFLSGIAIAIVLVLVCGLIGGGYLIYTKYIVPQIIITKINVLHEQFTPIEDKYDTLLTDMDGYDTTLFTQEKTDNLISQITTINGELEFYSELIKEQNSDEITGYTTALSQLSSSMIELNKEIPLLLNYAACYSGFDAQTSTLGQEFNSVNQSDTPAIIALYKRLSSATQDLGTCLANLNNPDIKEVESIVATLNDQTTIVIQGIENENLTQEQLNSFVATSVELQNKSAEYAGTMTTELESKFKIVNTHLSAIEAEEKKLSETYDIVFE